MTPPSIMNLNSWTNSLRPPPTTIEGMAALLENLAADPYWEEGSDPDLYTEPLIITALERSPDLVASLASTLRAIGGV